MKKSIQCAAVSAAAVLLFSALSFAQPGGTTTTVTPVGGTTTVTIEKMGYNVCYRPSERHVEGSRVVRRCGPYGGCQNFRITRDFYVGVNDDCHIEKHSCPRGYKSFGWYPERRDARDAVSRCEHTINGKVPEEWHINF